MRTKAKLAGPCAVFLALALSVPACAQEPPASGEDSAVPADSLFERASRSRAKGSREAPVTVFELSDFQCPYCARFTAEVFPRIQEEYIATGKVQWVYVNYPLPMHQRAWLAAEAAVCAGAAGGDFWQVHDTLFAKQQSWSGATDPGSVLRGYAVAAGAAPATYDRCVQGDLVAPLITQDIISASGTGATGTPAFVIGQTELVVGIRPYEEWKAILDKAIASAGGQ